MGAILRRMATTRFTVLDPSFSLYVKARWMNGVPPTTGMLAVVAALHVCEKVTSALL